VLSAADVRGVERLSPVFRGRHLAFGGPAKKEQLSLGSQPSLFLFPVPEAQRPATPNRSEAVAKR
jgi:hypothetical protein